MVLFFNNTITLDAITCVFLNIILPLFRLRRQTLKMYNKDQ